MMSIKDPELATSAANVINACSNTLKFVTENATRMEVLQTAARDLAFSLCKTYTGGFCM